jgi:hypothetical protein
MWLDKDTVVMTYTATQGRNLRRQKASGEGFRHVDLAEQRQQMVVAIPPRNRSWKQLICFDSPASSKKGPRIQR